MYQSNAGPEIPRVSHAMVFMNCLFGKMGDIGAEIGSGVNAIRRSCIASLRPAR